jgi:ribosome-binding factor A
VSGHHRARSADRLLRVLSETIRNEIRDPRVGFVTLTAVKLSADLQHAVAFVTVLDEPTEEDSLRALNHAAPFLRRAVARRAGLRFTPRLRFVRDDAVGRGMRLEELFAEIASTPPGADGEDS